jgi:hypothetical protein
MKPNVAQALSAVFLFLANGLLRRSRAGPLRGKLAFVHVAQPIRFSSKLWTLPGGNVPERPPQPLRLNQSRSLFNGNPDILPASTNFLKIYCQRLQSLARNTPRQSLSGLLFICS